MDDLLGAFGESIAHGGPMYALVGVGAILFCIYVWPSLDRRLTKADEREDRREERKAEESRLREQHDRETAAMQGRWLEQQDRSNAAMERSNDVTEGVRAQLERLADSLDDSKGHSRRMGEDITDIKTKTTVIYAHITGESGHQAPSHK